MRFRDRPPLLRAALSLLLAAALLGVVFQECAALRPACASGCCVSTPASLMLNFGQPPAALPDAAPSVPALRLLLLAVLGLAALPLRRGFPAARVPVPSRPDPGGRAPSRAQLHCWTL